MDIEHQGSDRTILVELGQRLRGARLERNLSQEAVAEEAGIGRHTLQRMEAGESPSLINFVRVLRALGLLGELERLLPGPGPSPIDELDRRGRRRQRAGGAREPGPEEREERWRWGDEEGKET
jgi:transcriptional regulator with XRE-family HTH domain